MWPLSAHRQCLAPPQAQVGGARLRYPDQHPSHRGVLGVGASLIPPSLSFCQTPQLLMRCKCPQPMVWMLPGLGSDRAVSLLPTPDPRLQLETDHSARHSFLDVSFPPSGLGRAWAPPGHTSPVMERCQ